MSFRLQGKDRKKEKQDKREIKVGIAYEGWRKTSSDRYTLENKVVDAGFSGAKNFQEYREAAIAQEFDLNRMNQGILNADGASWIRKVKDKSTCFQLDPWSVSKLGYMWLIPKESENLRTGGEKSNLRKILMFFYYVLCELAEQI